MRRLILAATLVFTALAVQAQSLPEVPQSQSEISLSFAPVVRKAAPAVVNIYAKWVTEGRQTPFMEDPFFERFFEGFGRREPRVQSSLGSGVILSADGLMVTNYHVVGMATEIRVVLTDRTEYDADVLLADQDSDLAVLQLDGARDLPFVTLRDSATVEVGELVLAIGNPFGVGQTVSSGIVSGLARSGGAGGAGHGYFIQTDAPINPGNSGGALVDMAGRVIGINTRIVSKSGGSNGIGFAIPAGLVHSFVEQAQAGATSFGRPWAGMSGQAVDFDMAQSLGLPTVGGIVVSGMHPSSPFLMAGFEVGDVIAAVDGLPVNTPSEMVYRMTVAGLGKTSLITRLRDGEAQDIAVQLVAAPDTPARNPQSFGPQSRFPGLTVARINPAVIAEMNLPIEAEGVVVTQLEGPAARSGLRPGDIIETLNNVPITDPETFTETLQASGRWFVFGLIRDGRRAGLRLRGG
ncbi:MULTISPECIES: trypsin-like peptidase domain-containing protein [Roseobacteraceae]|jgi:Do/DeqQ family serine protease|uniref:Periplasmic serine endoprotease DegP n=1 Tax=Pseudosulfitobacter pseudonitzschiae TaxID=1402135 RepID=A0A221K321_9RHOB|nr:MULTISPECIES: trypsin-like peptidase domain-containing protein [Roseobacteraceae]ASM73375.1 periplasmic serine endoprotease DegP [Pseudosulfitobacter pseudonitzschiae]